MSHSLFGNLLMTTALVQKFDDKDLKEFKTVLFKQLGCSNEAEFICKALRALASTCTLTSESSLMIQQKAVSISEKKQVQDSSKYPQLSLHKVHKIQSIEKQSMKKDGSKALENHSHFVSSKLN